MNDITALIFDIKRFAVHDGPGIRTTLFFKGCPLNCLWCHNPEGISTKKEIVWRPQFCIHCEHCINNCPTGALQASQGIIQRNEQRCTFCGSCVICCPTASQQLVGQQYTLEELFKRIKKDMLFFKTSNGGVTCSGGEPLMQQEFLKRFLQICQQKKIHTTLDTSGYASKKDFTDIMPFTDVFLFDVKFINDTQHKKYTGVSNTSILNNLESLLEQKKQVIIRFPLVPDITDTKENIVDILGFLDGKSQVKDIHILPFHTVKEKYEQINKPYTIAHIKTPSINQVQRVKEMFTTRGYHVKIGG